MRGLGSASSVGETALGSGVWPDGGVPSDGGVPWVGGVLSDGEGPWVGGVLLGGGVLSGGGMLLDGEVASDGGVRSNSGAEVGDWSSLEDRLGLGGGWLPSPIRCSQIAVMQSRLVLPKSGHNPRFMICG